MRTHHHAARDERIGQRIEYDDSFVVVVELPFPDEHVTVDVVGTTAIVVAEDEGGSAQAEIDLPGPAETIDVNNGVLTITIQK